MSVHCCWYLNFQHDLEILPLMLWQFKQILAPLLSNRHLHFCLLIYMGLNLAGLLFPSSRRNVSVSMWSCICIEISSFWQLFTSITKSLSKVRCHLKLWDEGSHNLFIIPNITPLLPGIASVWSAIKLSLYPSRREYLFSVIQAGEWLHLSPGHLNYFVEFKNFLENFQSNGIKVEGLTHVPLSFTFVSYVDNVAICLCKSGLKGKWKPTDPCFQLHTNEDWFYSVVKQRFLSFSSFHSEPPSCLMFLSCVVLSAAVLPQLLCIRSVWVLMQADTASCPVACWGFFCPSCRKQFHFTCNTAAVCVPFCHPATTH